jgi:hypothetical protein
MHNPVLISLSLSAVILLLKMEAMSSETSGCLRFTRHYNPRTFLCIVTAMRTSNPAKVNLSLCLTK